VLQVLEDPSAIPLCSEILRIDPQLTPQVVRYLRKLVAKEHDKVYETLQTIIEDVPLNRWQRLWLLDLCASDEVVSASLDRTVARWIKSNVSDSSEVVRGVTAWALARNWSLNAEQWNTLIARSTPLGSPWLSAALHTASGFDRALRKTVLSSDRLDRDIYRWVGEWNPFPRPF
jgi:hypothetical protein